MRLEDILAEDMIHETNVKAITENFNFIDILAGDATNPDKEV